MYQVEWKIEGVDLGKEGWGVDIRTVEMKRVMEYGSVGGL